MNTGWSFRISALLIMAMTAVSAPAQAGAVIDCPLRDAPYSVDSPLIDVLLKPEAKAAVDQAASGLFQGFPAPFLNPTAPSFASIITLRSVAKFKQLPPEVLVPLDAAFAQVSLTEADRQARCARYDVARPDLQVPKGKPRLLLFEKMTGFRDGPSVEAAHTALVELARRKGWAIVATDKGGAITPDLLKQFDAVIWNNVSGDVLTLTQRRAFQAYIEAGGGFVGLHGSGGDPVWFWDWYVDELIGARFAGHPMEPQFQDARVQIEKTTSGIGRDLAPGWTMSDEWYSFKNNPRASGATVIATLDESTYSPTGMAGKDLRMGDDHPIAWTRCVREGRSFYSAIGHRPEVYSEPHHLQLLEQGIAWAAGHGRTTCSANQEVRRLSETRK